ncbi:MAG: MarR family winged helix-turn-helix transcriptional regulator [Thermoplasmata archaeon]
MNNVEQSDPLSPEGHSLINIIKTGKILTRYMDRKLRSIGTSVVELGILHRIRNMGCRRLTDLAEDDFISKPRVSNILNAMVERGLIERVRDASDERSFELAISKSGEKLYSDSIVLINELSRELFKDADLNLTDGIFRDALSRIDNMPRDRM